MNFTLSLTEAELNIVFNSLTQRPFVEVAQLVGKLQQEVQAQAQKREVKND